MDITYIGHSTLLIEIGGKKILIDPNFDPALQHVLTEESKPGIVIDELPRLDMILLTHVYAGHLSPRLMAELQPAPLFAPPAVARWIRRRGMTSAIGFGPGESLTSGSLAVYPEAAAHFDDGRTADQWRTEKNMYLVATKYESVLLAGDTSLAHNAAAVLERELKGRRLDVALLSIDHTPDRTAKPGDGRLERSANLDVLTLFKRSDVRYLISYHHDGTVSHVPASAGGADVRMLDPGESFHASSLSS